MLIVLSSCYLLLSSNQNQSILFLFHIPIKFMTNSKNHLLVVVCVCFTMSCSKIVPSQDGAFQRSTGCDKKLFLVANHGGDL